MTVYPSKQNRLDAFAKWLTKLVMRDDMDGVVMAEFICRQLYKLGYIDKDGDKWKVVSGNA